MGRSLVLQLLCSYFPLSPCSWCLAVLVELQDSGQGCCCPPELPRLSGGVILSRIGFLVAADGQCVRSRDKLVVCFQFSTGGRQAGDLRFIFSGMRSIHWNQCVRDLAQHCICSESTHFVLSCGEEIKFLLLLSVYCIWRVHRVLVALSLWGRPIYIANFF